MPGVPLVASHMEAEQLVGRKAPALPNLEGAQCLGAAAVGAVAAMVVVDQEFVAATRLPY